jgi:prephenate dehydrogenase
VGGGYLHGVDFGVESARADLFVKGLFLVNAPHGTPGEAVKLATDLVGLLGATAIISDSMEADGLVASTHILPQLASAALLDATVNQPGWTEARKVAARPYANVTAAVVQDEATSLSEAAQANRESILRLLDAYMLSLANLREDIESGDAKAVTEFLDHAVLARERWLAERLQADWEGLEAVDKQSFGDKLSQMFLGNLRERNRKKK